MAIKTSKAWLALLLPVVKAQYPDGQKEFCSAGVLSVVPVRAVFGKTHCSTS